jgi:hypothetical protein
MGHLAGTLIVGGRRVVAASRYAAAQEGEAHALACHEQGAPQEQLQLD